MDGKDNDENEIKYYNQRFEIIGLTGTFSRNDGCHLHISLSDSNGNAIGGHLIDGTIFTTLELVLGTAKGVEFRRGMDIDTGYNELEVRQIIPKSKDSMFVKISMSLLAVSVIGLVASRIKSRWLVIRHSKYKHQKLFTLYDSNWLVDVLSYSVILLLAEFRISMQENKNNMEESQQQTYKYLHNRQDE